MHFKIEINENCQRLPGGGGGGARTPANPLPSSKFVPADQHADNDVFV